jgi:hypothetical protein
VINLSYRFAENIVTVADPVSTYVFGPSVSDPLVRGPDPDSSIIKQK